MISDTAKMILKRHLDLKGRKRVAVELGISLTSISLVLSGKYGASTDAIEQRIMTVYGTDGKINCPVLGKIEPARCAENHARAQIIRSAGNPATIRLFAACRKCELRNQ